MRRNSLPVWNASLVMAPNVQTATCFSTFSTPPGDSADAILTILDSSAVARQVETDGIRA